MKKKYAFIIFIMFLSDGLFAAPIQLVKGFNLSEEGTHVIDAKLIGEKTDAQQAVDHIKRIGGNHVVLNPRAIMMGPYENEIISLVPASERTEERQRYLRLIQYIHEQGMTVGIRPIFFVVRDSVSLAPYIENGKLWWHGNIEPQDPNRWFESFRSFITNYLVIGKIGKVEEFTIGAELYSMTVGIEDQWKEYPHGFPGRWVELLKYARSKLGENVRIMYDINFTDDSVSIGGGIRASGGELERWRYRLVDLATTEARNEKNQWWYDLVYFWKNLNAIGIDMYRSLASRDEVLPDSYDQLVSHLKVRAESYANQLDITLMEIESILHFSQKTMFKEVGYRSSVKGFVDPFDYDRQDGELSIKDQAAAYEAFFQAFFDPGFSWFYGVSLWDVAIDPSRQGPSDSGFSPIGKEQTETIIKSRFLRSL